MNEKILALQSQLELIEEANRVCAEVIINMIEEYIQESVTDPCGAVLLSKDFRYHYNNEFIIIFEVGFENKDFRSGIDFGSNIYFNYSTKENALSINHGAPGSFTKDNVYQIKRIKLLSHVFDHIEKIEDKFNAICNCPIAVEYAKNHNEHLHISVALNDAKSELEQQRISELEMSLREGYVVEYNREKVGYTRDMVFDSTHCSWTISRITDKRVKVKSEYNDVKQFDKETFLNLVYKKVLIVKDSE